jgi:hypothetical protein
MVLTATCDKCGAESSGCPDWDGQDLCEKCEIKKELDYVREGRKELKGWVILCWIKELREMDKEIKKLKEKLKKLEEKK